MNIFSNLNNFRTNNRDALLQLGMGLMSGQNAGQQMSYGAQGFGSAIQASRQAKEDQAKLNKTVQFLEQVNPQLAQAVRAQALPAAEAYKMHVAQTAGTKPTSALQEYEVAKGQGYKGTFIDFKRDTKGGVNVNVGGGPKIGTIPSGMQLMGNEEEGYRFEAIPGGPADLDAKKAAEQAQIGQQSKARSGNVVIEDIDRALEGINEGMLPSAGVVGGVLSKVPGTQAYDVGALIETVKANSGFDRLQAMRDSSPTGGALGAINQSEMALLQAALGNLEQSQSEDQLVFNLKRVRQIYDEIVNGPGGSAAQTGSEDFSTMSDEELRKIANGG